MIANSCNVQPRETKVTCAHKLWINSRHKKDQPASLFRGLQMNPLSPYSPMYLFNFSDMDDMDCDVLGFTLTRGAERHM